VDNQAGTAPGRRQTAAGQPLAASPVIGATACADSSTVVAIRGGLIFGQAVTPTDPVPNFIGYVEFSVVDSDTVITLAGQPGATGQVSFVFHLRSADLDQASSCEVVENTYGVQPSLIFTPGDAANPVANPGFLFIDMPMYTAAPGQVLKIKCFASVSTLPVSGAF
jgi:hypothetical protein